VSSQFDFSRSGQHRHADCSLQTLTWSHGAH